MHETRGQSRPRVESPYNQIILGSYRLRILHLSDLHERGPREVEPWRKRRIFTDAWQENLAELAKLRAKGAGTIINPIDRAEMIYIPAGKFVMGKEGKSLAPEASPQTELFGKLK